jgi:hypothetical protein
MMPLRRSGALAALALVGCTSSSGPAVTAGPDGASATDAGVSEASVTCQNDPRVDTFTANLSKTSTSGALKVVIVSGDPAPPTAGTNTWVIKVLDANGAPVAVAPKVDPFMPDHNHGTSIKAVANPQPDGTFQVTPLYLFMPGVWRITFTGAAADGGVPESVAFFFCVSD